MLEKVKKTESTYHDSNFETDYPYYGLIDLVNIMIAVDTNNPEAKQNETSIEVGNGKRILL